MNNGSDTPINLLRLLKLRSVVAVSMVLLFSGVFLASDVAAQDDPEDSLPPPPKFLSKEEKIRLSGDNEVKSRTRLALDLMNARLSSAEKEVSESDYESMIRELGAFEALLDDHLQFLIRNDNDSGKVLDNFKRFEIGLRTFVPRVETIRRELPSRFEPLVRNVGKYIRDARTRALEPLFSDTVVRQPRKPN